ncbi:DUF7115 domain-containing protein [Haloferacaceae archaeon DSL9]
MAGQTLLADALGTEDAVARLPLGGDDQIVVSPTRTLLYRADGLLSDESVDEFPHDAERLHLSTGRRRGTLTLDYGLGGEERFSVPTTHVDDIVDAVLAGVLRAADVIEADEVVLDAFRFGDLTLVVTGDRVVKHIGADVWDEDFEAYPYAAVSDLTVEPGRVATAIVLTVDGRRERFKTPNESARAVREGLTAALCAFYDVADLDEFRALAADDDEPATEPTDRLDFGDGPDPLSANPTTLSATPANATRRVDDPIEETAGDDGEPTAAAVDERPIEEATATAEGAFEGSPVESAGAIDDIDIASRLAALTEAVERQEARLERQETLLDLLVDELRRTR